MKALLAIGAVVDFFLGLLTYLSFNLLVHATDLGASLAWLTAFLFFGALFLILSIILILIAGVIELFIRLVEK